MTLSNEEILEQKIRLTELAGTIKTQEKAVAAAKEQLDQFQGKPRLNKKELLAYKEKTERHRQANLVLRNLLSRKFRLEQRIGVPQESDFNELRGLLDHQTFFNFDFEQFLLEKLAKSRAQGIEEPVAHVCDLSVGHGAVLKQLKNRFGNYIVTHGTALPQQPPTDHRFANGIQTLHLGDNLDRKSSFRQSSQQYDLMFSRRGEQYTRMSDLRGVVLSKLAHGGVALLQYSANHWPRIERIRRQIESEFGERSKFTADVYHADGRRKGKVPVIKIMRIR